MALKSLLFFVIVLYSPFIFNKSGAQDSLDSLTIRSDRPINLINHLNQIETQNRLRFFYLNDWLQPYSVGPESNGRSLRNSLNEILRGSDLSFAYLYNYAVVFYKNPDKQIDMERIISRAVEDNVKVEEVTIGKVRPFDPDEKVKLSGYVKDQQTNSPLLGVLIRLVDSDIGATTNALGAYELWAPLGEHLITFDLVNYHRKMVKLAMYKDGPASIFMEEEPTTLQEVVVVDQSIVTKQAGLALIKMANVKRTPAFFGESDVVKILQSKTGVTAVSEASTGFNVRGGGADQNLVLFDGTPIFNTGHALGFFSAFNSDAVKDAYFYKGGIPAEYGGRASSVLSLTSNEGPGDKLKGRLGIGFASANLTLGGPIKKDTSTFIVSLRSTYSDWVLRLLQSAYNDVEKSSVFFIDGSAKFTAKLSNGSKLTVSGYGSHDSFQISNDTINQWQNQALSVQYYMPMKNSLFYDLGLNFGSYGYTLSKKTGPSNFTLRYGIYYPSLKFSLHKDGLHKLTGGLQSTFYNFNPGNLQPIDRLSNSKIISMPDENAFETALFFSDAFVAGTNFHIEAGMRLSVFNRFGKATVYQYTPGEPLEPRNTVDSLSYDNGELIKTYFGPEPRLSLRYQMNSISSVKASYNRIYQYVHLVSNTATITPADIWQSSNTYFKPQIADQISIGYFRNSKNNVWESFAEGYYKHTENILDFKDGAQLILNSKLETALLVGVGKSYGVELSMEKVKGRMVGGLNYTYSRSLRKVNGNTKEEKINNGEYYAANYDQPHIVNLNWRYNLRRKVFFSGNFTFHSGRPISFPLSAYTINESPIIDYSERNNYRLPNYHRLDLAIIIEGGNKRKKVLDSQWTISVYNVYGRKNPYSAFFDYHIAGSVKPYQISLIGVPLPSITYQVQF